MVEKLVKQLNKPQTGDSSKNADTYLDGCIFTGEIPDYQHCTKLLAFPLLSLLYLQTSIVVWIHQNNHYGQPNISDRMGLHVLTYRFSWIDTKEVCYYCHYTYKNPRSREIPKEIITLDKKIFYNKEKDKNWNEDSVGPC